MVWEDWSNLSSEILVLVIKKVQERAAQDNDEMRRVVAMAGVCRSWRLAIQSLLAAKPFSVSGLLQFPCSLREAGPLDKPMQCVLKRRGGQFLLYQSDCGFGQELRESKCNFLMGAFKRWRPGRVMFMLTADRSARSISSNSKGCIGKLRSNFWGTTFVLWDFQNGTSFCTTSHCNSENSNSANKARPVTFVRFTEEMVDGVRKRKMTCVVRTPRGCQGTSSALSCCPALSSHPNHQYGCFSPLLRSKSLWKWSCMSTINKSIRTVAGSRTTKGYLSLREEISRVRMEEKWRDTSGASPGRVFQSSENAAVCSKKSLKGMPGMLKKGPKVATFTGAIPEWDVKRQCWSLDFKGRATLPSMHNFQLLMPTPSSSNSVVQDDERTQLSRHSFSQSKNIERRRLATKQSVVMQLGKIGKGLYALEFRAPLSAFQAFNIALSSFATTVGAES